ncbi:PilZ domain-containing protein [Bacillus sp. REN16]|uniref:PilZ domain-containing protein n=1 Tax=Bacillus sp. REN16 TaxID=2887296 RepID=UPI001E63489F|nr:PilZ domain-containing protein [Bacillus sp. REN16]MCC3359155.1 PilZ domain-containing protein [Bacillus sp. REN16]
MSYIVFSQTILLVFLLILFIRDEHRLVKQTHLIETLHTNNKSLKSQLMKVKKFKPLEKRDSFRIGLPGIESTFTLIDFGNHSLGALKNKSFNGMINDISIGGLKFHSSYEFPVKYNIIMKISFTLHGEEFELKGKIIRREDHIKGKSVAYGVQFIDLSISDIKRLSVTLHNYQVAQRNKIS